MNSQDLIETNYFEALFDENRCVNIDFKTSRGEHYCMGLEYKGAGLVWQKENYKIDFVIKILDDHNGEEIPLSELEDRIEDILQ